LTFFILICVPVSVLFRNFLHGNPIPVHKVYAIGIRKQIKVKVKVKEKCSVLSSAFSKKYLTDNLAGLLEWGLSEK